jgi:hypothetical protein
LQPEEQTVFEALYLRAARVLNDMRLQEDLFTALEDVMLETDVVRGAPESWRYVNAAALRQASQDIVNQPEFTDLIRDALRDYWGGPRLTEDRLVQLHVVNGALAENEGNPARAVRAILTQAIESLKPEGQRSMTMTEWILYNILELRFVQGRKVRDVAQRLAMSEADLYRKQKFAIEQVARKVAEMEHRANGHNGANGSSTAPD